MTLLTLSPQEKDPFKIVAVLRQIVENVERRSVAVTVANLPAPIEGMVFPVLDSVSSTWGDTVTGTGANHVLAYYNGTDWTVAAR